MAADHRRKRLNGASMPGCSSWEQYRTKKKKLELPKNHLNSRSHISLEWDGNKKKVIAKQEQIGVSHRDLRPFIDSVPKCHDILGDVFAIPQDIFELENLTTVLSYEVWQTHLSHDEKNLLMQFLPRGLEREEVVEALLAGNNFHFGNPFLKWVASLCSGNLHPDAILQKELCLKADKREYYSEIQKYHNDMINYLQKLKETWESSMNPEKEVLQKMWSKSRGDAEKRIFSHANESGFRDVEENVVPTSESCSFIAEEKASSSDNQNSSVMKGGELRKRMYEKEFLEDKCRKPLVGSDDAGLRKGEQLQKHNINHSDIAEYTSYLRISKKQHELVKNMKHSVKGIQYKSLSRVLGNLDALDVQPHEEYVKEEQKKLEEHWLKLAIRDLPVAYTNWREMQLERHVMMKSLDKDMKDNLKSLMEDEEIKSHQTIVQDQNDPGARKHGYSDDEEKERHETLLQDPNDGARNQESTVKDDEDSGCDSPQYQSPQQISSLNDGPDLNPTDLDSENSPLGTKSNGVSPDVSEYSGNTNTADASVSQDVPVSSGGDVWPPVSMPRSYYNSTANHEYTSTPGLLLSHQVNEERRTQVIDLESAAHEEDASKDLLHRQSNDVSFSSFPNHDGNGLLHSLFKSQEIPSYHHEQKQEGLDFQSPNNVLMEDGPFTGHIQGQLHSSLPMEQEHKRHSKYFIEQNISDDIYPERGGYLIPRQGHVPPVNFQDWGVNPVHTSPRFQLSLNDDRLLAQNWFSGEHPVRAGWNGLDGVSVPSQSIGSNADQSLYSVLSQCNQLCSSSPFDSVGSTEQFTMPRNYGMLSGGTRINDSLPQAAHPLDYLGGRATASSLMPDDMGWMNVPQNSALHDPMGKPYLRSGSNNNIFFHRS